MNTHARTEPPHQRMQMLNKVPEVTVYSLIFVALIAAVTLAYYVCKANAVLAFWIAYVLTRPLGASFGDYLSQATADGGLGLGTVVTSVIFLASIAGLVLYLSANRNDIESTAPNDAI